MLDMDYGFENGLNETMTRINELEKEYQDLQDNNQVKGANEDDAVYYERQQQFQKESSKILRKLKKITKEEDTIFDKQIEYGTFKTVAIDKLSENSNKRGSLDKEIKEYEKLIVDANAFKNTQPESASKYIDALVKNYQKEIDNRKVEIQTLLEEQKKLLKGDKEIKKNNEEENTKQADDQQQATDEKKKATEPEQ